MIEIGTSTHAIAGFGKPSKPFRQAVAEMAECGFTHFLLLASESGPAVDSHGDAPEALVNILASDLDAVRRVVSSHGIRIGAVYPGCAVDYSPGNLPKTVEKLKVYRDLAWRLGCHVMAHSAGRAEKPRTPLEKKKEQVQRVAELMDAVSSDTPGELFKMAVDVHYGGIIETAADCEYLLDCAQNTNSGLCLNMGHMTTLGQEGWTLLERFPDRIHVLAWKDHLLGENLPRPVISVELGTGKTPFHRYADVYRRVDCRALNLITFEDVPFDQKKDALMRSREYLERLLRS
jgi:sugar phosphate isomerase/epimerase